MGLFDRFTGGEIEAVELTGDAIPDEVPAEMSLFHVRPYRETPGFDAATEFVKGIAPMRGGPVTVEPWFDEGRIKFTVGAPSRGRLADVINAHFPNSVINPCDSPLPEMEPGEYVAGARMALSMDCAYPIRHPASTEGFDIDPYKSILPKLVGRDCDRVVWQVTFRPISSWYKRGVLFAGTDEIAESRGEGRVVGELTPEVIQTEADRKVKADMQAQRPRPAYRTVVRVLTISPEQDAAARRTEAVAATLASSFDHISGQGLETRALSGAGVTTELWDAARRTIPTESWLYRQVNGPANALTDQEVAALAHLPNGDINIPDVDWSRMESGPGAPPDAPQFDDGRHTTVGDAP